MTWKNLASSLAALLLLTTLGLTARADDAATDEARKHFKAGVAYLEDPDGSRYEEAIPSSSAPGTSPTLPKCSATWASAR